MAAGGDFLRGFTDVRDMAAAKEIQLSLREKVRVVPFRKKPNIICAVDAAFTDSRVVAAACLYEFPSLSLLKEECASMETLFPYIPGYLSFREGPAIVEAFNKLEAKPDLILVDGQGIAHPKGIGIASHLGVVLNIPTIGCAKSRLIGEYEEPGSRRGDWSSLTYQGNVIGAVLRTRDNVSPLFVSPGHMIDIPGSIDFVLSCVRNFRLPEPIRRADALSKRMKLIASDQN